MSTNGGMAGPSDAARESGEQGAGGAGARGAGARGAGAVLVRAVMVGFKPDVPPKKKTMQLAMDTAQEMMQLACDDYELDYDASSMYGPKFYMLPFKKEHDNHILELTAKFLKTVDTYHGAMVRAHQSGEALLIDGGRTTHVLGIDILVVNRKNKIAMQFYDEIEVMARVIAHNDESIVQTKAQSPEVWANLPATAFHAMYEEGAVKGPVHVKV